MSRFFAVLASVCVCALLVTPVAQAEAKKQKAARQTIQVDQLPQAVRDGVQKAYPGSSIVSAYKMTRGSEVRYELSIKRTADAQPMVVAATADGQIRGAKGKTASAQQPARKTAAPTTPPAEGDPVAIDQLPKTVANAIKSAYPKDTIVQASKTDVAGVVTYHVVLNDVSSLMPLRVAVSADGKIQKR